MVRRTSFGAIAHARSFCGLAASPRCGGVRGWLLRSRGGALGRCPGVGVGLVAGWGGRAGALLGGVAWGRATSASAPTLLVRRGSGGPLAFPRSAPRILF